MAKIDNVIKTIISHQKNVLGPLAVEQANTVPGLRVDVGGKVKISLKKGKSDVDVLMDLVKKYEQLFGQASVEVCKDAIKESGVKLDQSKLPDILR